MAEVRIHDANDLCRRRVKAFHNRCAQSQLARAVNDGDAVLARKFIGDCSGAIRRVVVDDDELELDSVLRARRKQRPRQLRDAIALVVGRHDHGQVRWPTARGDRNSHASTIIRRTADSMPNTERRQKRPSVTSSDRSTGTEARTAQQQP